MFGASLCLLEVSLVMLGARTTWVDTKFRSDIGQGISGGQITCCVFRWCSVCVDGNLAAHLGLWLHVNPDLDFLIFPVITPFAFEYALLSFGGYGRRGRIEELVLIYINPALLARFTVAPVRLLHTFPVAVSLNGRFTI